MGVAQARGHATTAACKKTVTAYIPLPLYHRTRPSPILAIEPANSGCAFELIDEECEVLPGMTIFHAPGHSVGHMAVRGLADGATLSDHQVELAEALARGLPLVCSNPDRLSPRHDGPPIVQPGALAAEYERRGGRVVWYGKP